MKRKLTIVGHHSRLNGIYSLFDKLCKDFEVTILVDDKNKGANHVHKWALTEALEKCHDAVILEDDSLPVAQFSSLLEERIDEHPNAIVSFYLGTGRPPQYQHAIRRFYHDGGDWLMLDKLIHGVAYYVPHKMLGKIVTNWNDKLPADYAVTYSIRCARVYYHRYSIVEHSDVPSVEMHADGQMRTEVRKAWCLYGQD